MAQQAQTITEELQQVKKDLQRMYRVLDTIEHSNKVYEKHLNKELEETINLPLKNTSYTINATNTTPAISEKEFNYKMAAHDLISPLTTQFTLLDVLKEELLQAIKHIDSLAISNSESLKRSRAALGNKEEVTQPILFKQLIDVIIQLFGIKELHKHIDVVVQVHTKKDFFNNKAIVQSIMQNLIQNAVKYSKPNQKNTITVTVNDTNNGVEMIVQDTGIGMDKERVSKLFKQVVESHATIGNSHGFGLYGVAQYVAMLNGTIKAESKPHVGSTFRVVLPSLKN